MLFRSLAILLSITVSALPTGAPKCAINPVAIKAAHGSSPDPSLGYTLSVTKSGTGTYNITVKSSAMKSFKGILMYITSPSAPSKHLGKFTFDSRFRAATASVCAAANITGDLLSTFTHASPIDKTLMTFVWSGSAAEIAGDLVVNAVIANLPSTPTGAKTGTPRWMVVNPVNVKTGVAVSLPAATSSVSAAATANATVATSGAGREFVSYAVVALAGMAFVN
jgi:Reeler domain